MVSLLASKKYFELVEDGWKKVEVPRKEIVLGAPIYMVSEDLEFLRINGDGSTTSYVLIEYNYYNKLICDNSDKP
jgi:hypothetical protein